MTIQVRTVSGIERVRFRGPGILKITQGEPEGLTLHAPRYGIDDIESTVTGGELVLGYRPVQVHALKLHREIISYDLKVKRLERLVLTGTGRAVLPDLDADHLVLEVQGPGRIRLDQLTADHLEVLVNGRGNVTATGDVESQRVVMREAASYNAHALVSDFAVLRVSGVSRAEVAVNESLDVNVAGDSSVSYAGHPEISKLLTGIARLQRSRRSGRSTLGGDEHG